MTTTIDLAQRRAELERHPVLDRLARRLRKLLQPLLDRPLAVPGQKALLSRDGGVCASDGARLTFAPLEPVRHRCPRCGTVYQGERHDRWWLTRYHIWLSERAIHMALLAELTGEAALATRAAEVLRAYAAQYRDYPNRDNVLGPTRLFFSTYLESIWLTQIVVAAELLDRAAGAAGLRATIQPMVAESAGIIASYDEAWSNRQVWNNAALVAAGGWLGDSRLVAHALDGPHGLRAQLAGTVSDEGMWWEGENYHFFALRGFLLAAEVLRWTGVDLYHDGRLGRMYTAPLRALLPDLTLPARGDAPYGVSVVQPRFAELWEIGRARAGHAGLDAALAGLYAADAPERDDPGFDELAEQEQNRPPQRLTREMLGWKALWWMLPEPPAASAVVAPPAAEAYDDLGLVLLRPAADRYVSVECAPTLGGHGHPDVLHLTLYWGAPWLADFGTGSYVSPSLHWYRSTLAHNAPGVAGQGQAPGIAWCGAADASGAWSWCRAMSRDLLGAGSEAVRTVIAGPDYVLDVVEIAVPGDITVDLPIHPLGTLDLSGAAPAAGEWTTAAASGHEHGYDAALNVRQLDPPSRISVTHGDAALDLVLAPRPGETVFAADAPGPPDLALADVSTQAFVVRRARGAGAWVQVLAGREAGVTAVRLVDKAIEITRTGARVDRITLTMREARVSSGGAEVILRGTRPMPPEFAAPRRPPIPNVRELAGTWLEQLPAPGDWSAFRSDTIIELGAESYRRSETPYGAVPLGARVAIFAAGTRVGFAIEVAKPDLVIRDPAAPDPALDNEAPDIHSDGVQCYVNAGGWRGFVVLPDTGGDTVRARAVVGTAGAVEQVGGSWRRTAAGYAMVVTVDVGVPVLRGMRVPVNVVVNEMRPGRERRAGQLALSGGGWVYLRGDREAAAEAVVVEIQ